MKKKLLAYKTKSTFCHHIAQLVRDEIQEVKFSIITWLFAAILSSLFSFFLQAKESTEKY